MSSHVLTLNIPDPIYRRLKDRAEKSHRSVEDETVEALGATVPIADGLPADLQDAISPLALLDDESLWRAARSTLPPEASERMEELHGKKRQEELTVAETQALQSLMRRYEKTMVVRAQAAALLHQRGHDVSTLLQNS